MLRRPGAPALPSLSAEGRRSLRGPLVLGCVALMVALCVPSARYLGLVASAESPDATRMLPVPVREMEQRGRVPATVDVEHAQATQFRVAANILLQSGYLVEASMQPDEATGRVAYSMLLRPEVSACAYPPTGGGGEAADAAEDAGPEKPPALDMGRASMLAVAAVAVEKFNRTELQRRFEWAYAQAMLAVTGHLPDLSLGPAQIRPSTVRRLLASGVPVDEAWDDLATDDQAMLTGLMDECQSLALAAAVMRMYACTGCDDPADQAVRSYAGQRRQTGAVVDYAPVVGAMASMLR